AGYGALLSVYEDSRKEHFADVYTLHIMKDNRIGGHGQNKAVVNYSGKVYCVTVPSGMVLVKRNRCTAVCGNSGDPVKIICGDESSSDELVRKGLIESLWDIFGGTINEKGYKELDPHIGAIYGDAINLSRCEEICGRLAEKGFASTNMIYGIGSFSYQYNTRDTFGFALKSTYAIINGEEKLIYKDPKTDDGTKRSQRGLVHVHYDEAGEITYKDGLSENDYSMTDKTD